MRWPLVLPALVASALEVGAAAAAQEAPAVGERAVSLRTSIKASALVWHGRHDAG